MASSKPLYGWSEISAAQQKKIPLPDRFLCRDCKKFKSPQQYSNKQLNDYRFKVHTHQRATHISAELRCRNCTGDQTQELQCTGPCDLWKGLEDFSKNQRKRPENAWCVSCTQWKEANEPGVTPVAPPNNLLSPDEEKEMVETEADFGVYAIDDIEGEADSDDETGFIYASMAATSLADGGMVGSSVHRGRSNPANNTLPGYLTGAKKLTSVLDPKPSVDNPFDSRSEYGGKKLPENNPPGNDTGGNKHPLNAGTGRAAVDGKRPKTGIAYNAWDNVGQIHSLYRAPSQSTAPTGSSGLVSRLNVQIVSSGVARETSANETSVNTNRPDAQAVSSGQAGGWARQTHATRNPAPRFPPLGRPIKQNICNGDDDDSPDEM